jgi:hypothetical protein
MSSGAFALYVDPAAGSGGSTIKRVIPLPPTGNQGVIGFNQGFLSLAYDDFGQGPPTVSVRFRVITSTGAVRVDQTDMFPVGRTVATEIFSGDLAASFEYPAPGQSSTATPALSALVEFSD